MNVKKAASHASLGWMAVALLALLFVSKMDLRAQTTQSKPESASLGFDRNDYPGDGNLVTLRHTFSFTGYWLNVPPGATQNSWTGKRAVVRAAGFGFLVLFNGRLDNELKRTGNAGQLGSKDASTAVESARREGFPPGTIVFLDQEEGGRMLPEQKAYIYAWVDGVNAGGFRAGVYCSGIAAPEGNGISVITAEDIRQNAAGRRIAYWVTNDACPPSPGCKFPSRALAPSKSGIEFAEVWQYAQSPKRKEFAARCPAYSTDGNCYPPGLAGEKLFIDADTAKSKDPSAGR